MASAEHPHGSPSIALIHGVPTSIAPAMTSLQEAFPGARLWNILDDKLIEDANHAGSVTLELQQRMERLIAHALAADVDAVVITCSLYAFLAAQQAGAIPVLGSDDAAFREATDAGGRVLLVSSVPLALRDSQQRLTDFAHARGHDVTIVPVFVEGALAAVARGDTELLAGLITDSTRPRLEQGDVMLFAQYSLAPAAAGVAQRLGVPVISPPAATARALRSVLSTAS